MNEAKIKACVESYERHLDGAVKMGELPVLTDIKHLTNLLTEILKAHAGDRKPEAAPTAELKPVRFSDRLDAGVALKKRMEANGWLKSKQWPDHTAANWKGTDGSEKSIKELLYELLESI